jgi:hypothetical protein
VAALILGDCASWKSNGGRGATWEVGGSGGRSRAHRTPRSRKKRGGDGECERSAIGRPGRDAPAAPRSRARHRTPRRMPVETRAMSSVRERRSRRTIARANVTRPRSLRAHEGSGDLDESRQVMVTDLPLKESLARGARQTQKRLRRGAETPADALAMRFTPRTASIE